MAQIQAGTVYVDGGQVNATNLNAHVNNAVLLPGVISTQIAVSSCTSGDSILLLQSGSLKQATLAQAQAAVAPDLTPYVNKNGSVAMTGELTLSSASPAGTQSAVPKTYVDTNLASGLATKQNSLGYVPVNKAGDTMTGLLVLSANPSAALGAATKQYVDAAVAGGSLGYTPVNKAGDTMTGPLVLSADPSVALGASTKQYVDTSLAAGLSTKQNSLGFTPVNKAGDTGVGAMTFSGAVTLAADPTTALQASTKAYVDAQVTLAGPSLVPPGAIMAFYRSTPPAGWLECNGQSTALYPNLVALGIIAAPDLRGEFVRGWDNSRGIDPGRALGTSQADEFKSHTHQAKGSNILTGASNAFWWDGENVGAATRTTLATGGSETRPRNIALMYCIKT